MPSQPVRPQVTAVDSRRSVASPERPVRRAIEGLVAAAYGLTYDAIVARFEPYQEMLREITALVDRSIAGKDRAAARVVDVACGTGTVALALAAGGYSVVGLDAVERLVRVARKRSRNISNVAFHALDAARDTVPGAGSYDVVVSVHTLYWHADPSRLLEGCHQLLKPGGHAVFLTYSRPARVLRTFSAIRAAHGLGHALDALRWLAPTALFEVSRHYDAHYMTREEFHDALAAAGFRVLQCNTTFLAQISLLAWAQADGTDGALQYPTRKGGDFRIRTDVGGTQSERIA